MDREFATVENQMNGTSNGGFLKYASVLVRWWRFVVVNVVVVTVVAAIVSFVLPKWYRATASILPPKDQGSFNLFGGSGSVLKGLSSLSKLGGVGQNSGAYNYLAILKSRSAMEAVVSRFDLRSVYGIDDSSIEKAVKQLKENVEF
ncbi:MAG: hypothetical protein HY033_05555 [Ignavibacteriae bacterium]|nr:hypothetical protein [Ignavibacteriota bacterium]